MSSEQPTPPRRATTLWLTLYYVAIFLGVIALHAHSNFKAPPFVYGGF